METTYLPSHLLKPFFNEKEIFYTQGTNPEQRGWLSLTVFADGSVSLQLYSAASNHGGWSIGGQTLSNDMLDKVFWDSGKQVFVAAF